MINLTAMATAAQMRVAQSINRSAGQHSRAIRANAAELMQPDEPPAAAPLTTKTTDNPRRSCVELGVCQAYNPPCGQCHWMDAYDTDDTGETLWEQLIDVAIYGAATALTVALLAGLAGYWWAR